MGINTGKPSILFAAVFTAGLAGLGNAPPAMAQNPATAVAAPRKAERASLVAEAAPADSMNEAPPGAPPLDATLAAKLKHAWETRAPGYKPNTRHLNPDGSPRYVNRLLLESSPYLLQHAHNPVDWYPWGDEAFAAAARLGRPILLSVGYSTCHWCHVMAEESFEDEEIARYLNAHYVAIKVDREERPDVDAIYMGAVQALTGAGGWPLTAWLTPERKPFFGGTYFPPHAGERGARLGLVGLLQTLAAAYAEQPGQVAEAATQLVRAVQDKLALQPASADLPDRAFLRSVTEILRQNFDWQYGGLAGSPKFPGALPIRFLLRYAQQSGDQQALSMAVLTLEKMAAGGVYDQVGGGFHRYATDERWRVPHFEKMLYDNALLTMAYLEAYQATGREDFAQVASDILRYIERDMMAPQGGFYAATDADSLDPAGHLEEGRFFTWTMDDLAAVLGQDQARVIAAHHGVAEHGSFHGRTILRVAQSLERLASEFHMPLERVRGMVRDAKEFLYAARAKRSAPARDEKIIAAWNGLMISAYARAALALQEGRHADRAARAADFVLTNLRRDGRLLRSFKDGQARSEGFLEDYAFVIAGLLDLYEAQGSLRWLKEALALDKILEEHYEDKALGGFFRTSDAHEPLLLREKPIQEGAEPSGNSVQALNLLRLHEFTLDERYRMRAQRAMQLLNGSLLRAPTAFPELLMALDYHLDMPKAIIIVTAKSRADAAPFLARMGAAFVPNRVLAVINEGEELSQHAALIPLMANKVARDGKATAYVCENQVCALPTTDPVVFAEQISRRLPATAR